MNTFKLVLVGIALFCGILSCMRAGRWFGDRTSAEARKAMSPLSGAVFALMGLLIAFTFSGAAQRYEAKRQLIVDETTAIGTAYKRIDLLPAPRQQKLRETFRRYLELRIGYYRAMDHPDVAESKIAETHAVQDDIWSQAIVACREVGVNPTNTVVLSSLNTMFDVVTAREAATLMHPPGVVIILLALLPLICSMMAGFEAAGKDRSLLHILGFAIILSVTTYVILDYEFPGVGFFVHFEATDQILVALRQSLSQ